VGSSPALEMPLSSGLDPEQSVRLMKMKIRGDTREASLRVTSFDALARKLPTVTEGVVETNLQYGMQMWDFGVD
jgi:hypothetical protein